MALTMRALSVITVPVVALAFRAGSERYEPARLVEATLPPQPAMAAGPVGGGEVLLEIEVDTDGRVGSVERLRVTPPYTDQVISVVEGWRFTPAARVTGSSREAIAQNVLVAAVFRPPALYLGTTQGEPPRDVADPSAQTPVLRDLVFPTYPPNARGNGIVLVEVEVGPAGETADLRIVISGGGFDDPALVAVRRWSFDPPKQPDGPMRSYVYAIVGFREPMVTTPRRPPAVH